MTRPVSLTTRLLDYLEQFPGATFAEISTALGHDNEKSLHRILLRLAASGRITRRADLSQPIGVNRLRWAITGPRFNSDCTDAELHDSWTPGEWVNPIAARHHVHVGRGA